MRFLPRFGVSRKIYVTFLGIIVVFGGQRVVCRELPDALQVSGSCTRDPDEARSGRHLGRAHPEHPHRRFAPQRPLGAADEPTMKSIGDGISSRTLCSKRPRPTRHGNRRRL